MDTPPMLSLNRMIVVLAVLALFSGTATGHVTLELPNGGEQLEVGEVFTITWHVDIEHSLQNWDLWYSTTASDGPWTILAMDLPPGDPSAGSVHTYDWTIPASVDDTVWVRVRQDNNGTDYYDVSDAPFSILPIPGDVDLDGMVGISDLLELLSVWGPCGECAVCPADLDGDCSVGITDLLVLLSNWT